MFKTQDELNEVHGSVEMKFSSYYKYSFTYIGTTADGKKVVASVGGDSGDIYKMEVVADKMETLQSLYPSYVKVDGENVFRNW